MKFFYNTQRKLSPSHPKTQLGGEKILSQHPRKIPSKNFTANLDGQPQHR